MTFNFKVKLYEFHYGLISGRRLNIAKQRYVIELRKKSSIFFICIFKIQLYNCCDFKTVRYRTMYFNGQAYMDKRTSEIVKFQRDHVLHQTQILVFFAIYSTWLLECCFAKYYALHVTVRITVSSRINRCNILLCWINDSMQIVYFYGL